MIGHRSTATPEPSRNLGHAQGSKFATAPKSYAMEQPMRKCPHCGEDIPKGATPCPECGMKIGSGK